MANECAIGNKGGSEAVQRAPAAGTEPTPESRHQAIPTASRPAAEQAGLQIKKSHPIVSVTVYDSVEGVNKSVDLPNSSGEPTS
jgi:hypothetical protein